MEDEPTEISDKGDSEAPQINPKAEGLGKDLPSQTETVDDKSTFIRSKVGNFEIVALLGEGAFGAVYKARDTSLGRDVAIKFLHNPLDAKRQKLFEREARALAALSKEASIVEVYQWGQHERQNYIVLEFVDGGTEKLLEDHPSGLPIAQALGIVADCAEALHAAHEQGILHRDIKPANILVEPASGRAKVADFGLARLNEDSDFTLAGGVSGSPPYMSPEQASAGELDGRSDIFSLGVTLYELLCGERPFGGESASQVMNSIRQNKRTPLKTHRPDLSESVFEIVEKATAHKPDQRYQTAGDFAKDLREVVTALERSGQAVTPSIRPGKASAFRRHLNNALAAVVITLLCGALLKFAIGGTVVHPDPNKVFAQAKERLDEEDLSAALALFTNLQERGMAGHDIVIDAYISHIEEETKADRSDEVMAQSRRLGEKLRKIREAGPARDDWTSRPISFFTKPVDLEGSNYVATHDLAKIFDQALDRALMRADRFTYVDRKNLQILLEEQERALDLSDKEDAIYAGNFIAARLLVGASFLQLTPNSPEEFSLAITDVETTRFVSAPTLALEADTTPDEFLIAAAESLGRAVDVAFPLRARLYKKDGQPVINIGTDVDLEEGMRFEILPDPRAAPLAGMSATVSGAPGASESTVTVEGLPIEKIPESIEDGWYVQISESPAPL